MTRYFKRDNVVRATEDNYQAENYLAAGYTEIEVKPEQDTEAKAEKSKKASK